MMEWITMTARERVRATALNDRLALLGARRVTQGDLAGHWVVPSRVLADPAYERWHTMLSSLPRVTAPPDALFSAPEQNAE